jgi:hypothetical protein
MPHARIVAESLERARLVARQLEARGYTVELVAPGAPTGTPADLEITVTADSSLPFADEVYAAPGSILGLGDYEPEDKPAPEYYILDDQPASAGSALREGLAQARQAFTGTWQSISGTLASRVAAYRSARAERYQQEQAEREQRRAAAERVRAEQVEAARLARIAAEQERKRVRAQQAETSRLARIAAEHEKASRDADAAESARLAEIAAEKERARLRAIELERQRVARQAAEAEEARRLVEYGKVLAARRAEEKLRREEMKAADQRRRRATQQRPFVPPEPVRNRPWGAAFAGAASVSALAVLALFFSSADRRPAAPVSNQTVVTSPAVEQQVPFGAATALPAEAAAQKAAPPASSVNDAPRPRPQPRPVFRVDADSGMDEAEPEVIVRRRSARPPRNGEQASRVKRITDDDMEGIEEEELE